MAIDDNTVYGLTGAQVKELPEKIEAVRGLAKELTSADYNYPTDSPTSVALWLLEPGVYTSPAGVNVCITSTSTLFVTGGGFYVVGAPASGSGNSAIYVAESSGASGDYPARALVLNSSGGTVRDKILLGEDDIINTLSGTDSSKVLSARQGKVLKDLIDAIQVPTITMTTTDPGEGAALAANNYIGVYGGDPIILDYFTSETNTGTYWIDGSAIYKKTINTGTLPNATTKSVAYNVSGLSRVIAANGYAYRTSDGGSFPLPFVSTTSANSIAFSINTTTGAIEIVTGIDRSNITESYITLYYTKSS